MEEAGLRPVVAESRGEPLRAKDSHPQQAPPGHQGSTQGAKDINATWTHCPGLLGEPGQVTAGEEPWCSRLQGTSALYW